MKKGYIVGLVFSFLAFVFVSFKNNESSDKYYSTYNKNLEALKYQQQELLNEIERSDLNSEKDIERIQDLIILSRNKMKGMDFWMRYLDPLSHKRINGPLPVEWETEVFEKFEKPYKREGTGLTIAAQYLEEPSLDKELLRNLIKSSLIGIEGFYADSTRDELKNHSHFFLCNRLFLLNLASIYTTGFECPDTSRVIPELRIMLEEVNKAYLAFNESFPSIRVSDEYLKLYKATRAFVYAEPADFVKFDNYTFLRSYVNPLFALNQKMIVEYEVSSRSVVDYSLNKYCNSIFNKTLFVGQNTKGLFIRVKDPEAVYEIDRIGKLLFYDPVLSGNNLRSCASCHKPTEYFTDTVLKTSQQFNKKDFLSRNSPSLLNAEFNHLLMMDGKHFSLQNQAKGVIINETELGASEEEVLRKVMSCKEYNESFKKLLKYTPQEKEVTIEHINSAITFYYSKFSKAYSPFDEAMNNKGEVSASVKKGFNLFMTKAQCATCHFVPQFNGVKPPFVGSEFEVLGVPEDNTFEKLSPDKGRFEVNPAEETLNAFRTGSIRNAEYTKPYMHNGAFSDLKQVIDFYNTGGGAGRGLTVNNQTLSTDSLHLTSEEKVDLINFIKSLNEDIPFEKPPVVLPVSKNKILNTRKVGGEY